MSLALVGRIAGMACAAVALATACGGRSVRATGDGEAADDGSSDDGSSDDGSSDDGASGGSIAVGGATAAGGASYGGTAQGGVATGGTGGVSQTGGVAGTVGVGGMGPCADCPVSDWDYGLVIEGDGRRYAMNYNGYFGVADADEPMCAATPLRGSIGGCGYFDLHACTGPRNQPPCLEIVSGNVRYLDANGVISSGPVRDLTSIPSVPGVAAGTLSAELLAPIYRNLRVGYAFCNGFRLLDVCR